MMVVGVKWCDSCSVTSVRVGIEKEVLIYIRAESLRFHKRFHRIFTNLFVNQLILTCIREDEDVFTTVFQKVFERISEGYFHLYTVS